VILVTHHTQWLAGCDLVIELADGGTVARQGKPSEIDWAPRGGSSTTLSAQAQP
jgi:ABC-type transport system involved in cytochrome bd biosynthesis fused ATPase/permease subunit